MNAQNSTATPRVISPLTAQCLARAVNNVEHCDMSVALGRRTRHAEHGLDRAKTGVTQDDRVNHALVVSEMIREIANEFGHLVDGQGPVAVFLVFPRGESTSRFGLCGFYFRSHSFRALAPTPLLGRCHLSAVTSPGQSSGSSRISPRLIPFLNCHFPLRCHMLFSLRSSSGMSACTFGFTYR